MPFWLDIIVKLTPACVSLVLGIFGTYIAFNQYRTNQDKLRLDLFEKRIEAYEKLQEYFNCVFREACIEDKTLAILAEARYKSLFIFGDDISAYINEVWDKAREIRQLQLQLNGPDSLPIGEARNKVIGEESELLAWNIEQLNDSSKLYFKYLKFR